MKQVRDFSNQISVNFGSQKKLPDLFHFGAYLTCFGVKFATPCLTIDTFRKLSCWSNRPTSIFRSEYTGIPVWAHRVSAWESDLYEIETDWYQIGQILNFFKIGKFFLFFFDRRAKIYWEELIVFLCFLLLLFFCFVFVVVSHSCPLWCKVGLILAQIRQPWIWVPGDLLLLSALIDLQGDQSRLKDLSFHLMNI